MNKLTIPSFIKTLMPALNDKSTQEASFRLLFDLLYDETDCFVISSNNVSDIMNGKEDIPKSIRQLANRPKATDQSDMKEMIKDNICIKVVPILKEPLKEDLAHAYSKLIENDNNISPEKKEKLLGIIRCGNEEEYLTELFMYAVSIPFRRPDDFREIYYCSSVMKYNENDNMLTRVKEQYGKYIDLDKTKSKSKDAMTKDLVDGELYKLTTMCSFETEVIRGSYFANVNFEYNDKSYTASTSCSNWLSQSKLNKLLGVASKTTMVFEVIRNDQGRVHIIIMGELN